MLTQAVSGIVMGTHKVLYITMYSHPLKGDKVRSTIRLKLNIIKTVKTNTITSVHEGMIIVSDTWQNYFKIRFLLSVKLCPFYENQ